MKFKTDVIVFLCLFLFLGLPAHTQPYTLRGTIVDAETTQPIAFANIVIDNSNRGVVSDIDGRFVIVFTTLPVQLRCSSVGYEPKSIQLDEGKTNLIIKLLRISVPLPEVVVIAGENPAHRIIRLAIENSDLNNYEKLPSFAYTSYDKMILTAHPDSIRGIDSLTADSSRLKLMRFVNSQHLFLFETVSKRRFLYPGRNHQKVVASRVAGFRDPVFVFLLSQLQSTSFYNEVISISDKNYVNPISKGSLSRYYFSIDDTLFLNGKSDTTFVISYRPRARANFDGLKGVIHINSNRWAIQHVEAEPSREEGGISIRIKQMYALIEGQYWFPVQLNTELVMKNVMMNGVPAAGQGRSYITDIVVNPALVRRMFNEVDVEVDPEAPFRSEKEWEKWRSETFTHKDKKTYQVLDSLGNANNFDRYARIADAVMNSEIPLGKINLALDKISNYNKYEKFRLGLGFATNSRFSRWFRIGAWAAYGFGDKAAKYGADVFVSLDRYSDAGWYARLSSDVKETGSVDPFLKGSLLQLNDMRSYLVEKMDETRNVSTGLKMRVLPYITANIELSRDWKAPAYDYFYSASGESPWPKAYVFTELMLQMRMAYRERILQTTRSRVSMGTTYPIVYLRYTRGIKGLLDGQFSYDKLDARVDYSKHTRYLGTTSLMIRAGLLTDALPYMQLFSGFGSHGKWSFYSPGSFSTMRINEFVADRHLSLFLTHDFGKLLIRRKYFEPEIVVAANAGFGWLKNQNISHHNIPMCDFSRGYFESGLLINNLINIRFARFGAGAFYRLGPYQLDSFTKNISYKTTLSFAF